PPRPARRPPARRDGRAGRRAARPLRPRLRADRCRHQPATRVAGAGRRSGLEVSFVDFTTHPLALRVEAWRLPRGAHKLPREVVVGHQRERLLSGAARALAEHGYASLTVEQVIEQAGVSRATFYENCCWSSTRSRPTRRWRGGSPPPTITSPACCEAAGNTARRRPAFPS